MCWTKIKSFLNRLRDNSPTGQSVPSENSGQKNPQEDTARSLIENRIRKNPRNKDRIDVTADNYTDYIESLQLIDRKKLIEEEHRKVEEHRAANWIFKFIRWVKKWFLKNDKDPHEQVAMRVYERLRLRNAQLRELEEQARGFLVNDDLKVASVKQDEKWLLSEFFELFAKISAASAGKSFEADCKRTPNVGSRAYHLAVTDLFVEKAMTYLEDRAEEYKKSGHKMIRKGQWAYAIGAIIACLSLIPIGDYSLTYLGKTHSMPSIIAKNAPTSKLTKTIEKIDGKTGDIVRTITTEDNPEAAWKGFTKSFSAIGMVVLVGVSLIRYGKAMLEQAEQLLERRHALRQGRLFVHLNDGKLTIEEMEEAFNWNVSGANAFSHLPTEAQAPWGNVISQIIHKVPELIKTGIEAISNKRK